MYICNSFETKKLSTNYVKTTMHYENSFFNC
jgi:hypothetical protein